MQAFRKTLVPGDAARNYTVVWDLNGLDDDVNWLVSGDGPNYPLTASYPLRNTSAKWAVRQLAIPDVPPGQYRIGLDPKQSFPVTVEEEPKGSRWTRFPAGNYDKLLGQLTAHTSKLTLEAGLHTWSAGLELPKGFTISGHGAVVRRIPNGEPGEPLFIGGDGCTLEGLTLEPWDLVCHADPGVNGLILKNCIIRGGRLGYEMSGCVFENCIFDGGDVTFAPKGLYLRCSWLRNNAGNAFNMFGPCIGELAMLDCLFDGTDRGPVFNTSNGAVTDNLFCGNVCRGINRDDNGNESFLAEGGHEFSRNLAIHNRAYDCDGHMFQLACEAHNNLIQDTIQDGGGGFWIMGPEDCPQTGNKFDNFELRNGAGITIGWMDAAGRVHGLNTQDNAFTDGVIVAWKPSRLNQGRYDPHYYQGQPIMAWVSGNSTETIEVMEGGVS